MEHSHEIWRAFCDFNVQFKSHNDPGSYYFLYLSLLSDEKIGGVPYGAKISRASSLLYLFL
jgi:hypothetical protein